MGDREVDPVSWPPARAGADRGRGRRRSGRPPRTVVGVAGGGPAGTSPGRRIVADSKGELGPRRPRRPQAPIAEGSVTRCPCRGGGVQVQAARRKTPSADHNKPAGCRPAGDARRARRGFEVPARTPAGSSPSAPGSVRAETTGDTAPPPPPGEQGSGARPVSPVGLAATVRGERSRHRPVAQRPAAPRAIGSRKRTVTAKGQHLGAVRRGPLSVGLLRGVEVRDHHGLPAPAGRRRRRPRHAGATIWLSPRARAAEVGPGHSTPGGDQRDLRVGRRRFRPCRRPRPRPRFSTARTGTCSEACIESEGVEELFTFERPLDRRRKPHILSV